MKNWVFSLFNLEFTSSDFVLYFFQWENYADETYIELEELNAVFHLSIAHEAILIHIMGFNIFMRVFED